MVPTLVAVGAAIVGESVGHLVEKGGPIDAATLPAGAYWRNAVLGAVAGLLFVLARRDRRWETVAIGVAACTAAIALGMSVAFDTIAGSRDCPGTQDCDTLIVPLLMPLAVVALAAVTVGAVAMQLVLVLRRRSGRGLIGSDDVRPKG